MKIFLEPSLALRINKKKSSIYVLPWETHRKNNKTNPWKIPPKWNFPCHSNWTGESFTVIGIEIRSLASIKKDQKDSFHVPKRPLPNKKIFFSAIAVLPRKSSSGKFLNLIKRWNYKNWLILKICLKRWSIIIFFF